MDIIGHRLQLQSHAETAQDLGEVHGLRSSEEDEDAEGVLQRLVHREVGTDPAEARGRSGGREVLPAGLEAGDAAAVLRGLGDDDEKVIR